MTHEDIKILISAYIDGEVTPSEKIIVEEHLSSCDECQKDFKTYKAMSSSLSKWSNESLSPDEEIKIHNSFQRRREPMFTKRTFMALGTTLALTVMIGTVVQQYTSKSYFVSKNEASYTTPVESKLKSTINNTPLRKDEVSTMDVAQGNHTMSADGVTLRKNLRYAEGVTAGNEYRQIERVQEPRRAITIAQREVLTSILKMKDQKDNSTTDIIMPAANYYQNVGTDYYSSEEQERKKIQKANLSLQVENAFKIKSQLTDLIMQFNGIIVNSQFSRSPEGAGYGRMVCKVYPKDLEPALQQIRKLGEVENENQSSLDVTDQYADAQRNMTKYQSDKDRLEKSLKSFKLLNPTTETERLSIQQQIEQAQEQLKALDRVIHFYQEQTQMSLVTIDYHDNYKIIVKEKDSALEWKERLAEKWKITIDSSVDVFSSIMFSSLIVLSYVAPAIIWILVFTLLFAIVQLFFRK